mmetsp:Transcript_51280/g.75047  ORF Transcript_51280/g.75047 Transcript_51280/m.75047 type:complete len:321 (+) Transcript_51280:531-1493(+)
MSSGSCTSGIKSEADNLFGPSRWIFSASFSGLSCARMIVSSADCRTIFLTCLLISPRALSCLSSFLASRTSCSFLSRSRWRPCLLRCVFVSFPCSLPAGLALATLPSPFSAFSSSESAARDLAAGRISPSSSSSHSSPSSWSDKSSSPGKSPSRARLVFFSRCPSLSPRRARMALTFSSSCTIIAAARDIKCSCAFWWGRYEAPAPTTSTARIFEGTGIILVVLCLRLWPDTYSSGSSDSTAFPSTCGLFVYNVGQPLEATALTGAIPAPGATTLATGASSSSSPHRSNARSAAAGDGAAFRAFLRANSAILPDSLNSVC